MATPVIMPRQGQSVESCIITNWHKQKGDHVKTGEILFSYETDKASFDEEAPEDGVLLEIFFEEDEDVPVLTNVCVLGQEGESTTEFHPNGQSSDTKPQPTQDTKPTGATTSEVPEAAPPVPTDGGRVKISPRARNLASKANVDFQLAGATGPSGRIIERDIIDLMENGPMLTPAAQAAYQQIQPDSLPEGTGLGGRITAADLKEAATASKPSAAQPVTPEATYEDVKPSHIRKVIAKSMYESLATTAQVTLHASFDATNILHYRKQLKENGARLRLGNITINDIVLFAVSRTLPECRELNAHMLDDTLRLFGPVHLGVATDTERGLMVPTVFNAESKSLSQISQEAKQRTEECKQGSINPDYLTGGTFTVTNLGTLGVEFFTPVLNRPQTGILGVNTIVQRVKEVDGAYSYYPSMGLSLTFDHRALDGAPAARFLQTLTTNLENFSSLLAK